MAGEKERARYERIPHGVQEEASMMRRLGRVFKNLGDDAGFTVAEVMVAFIILALALIPMVNMFDSAFQVSAAATDMNLAQECLRLYSERVKNIPFYYAHSAEDQSVKKDVDDFYWGSRSPVYDNGFSDAPYVEMKSSTVEPYKGMKVEIRMAYLDEELVSGRTLQEAADLTVLDENWGPMKIYGYDRPITDTGKALNLILYEVRVTVGSGRQFTSTNLYASPTDVLANVFIDKVVNVDTDANKKGTRYNTYGDCISAPHTQSNIKLRFYGEGFKAPDLASGLVSVKLVRVDDNDITPSSLVYGEDAWGRYLEGTVTLNSGGASLAHNPWSPRRVVGEWDAFLVVNHVISVRNKAFVVEYPLPIFGGTSGFYDSDGDRKGFERTTNEALYFTNVGYFTHIKAPEGQNPGIGATIQLIHTQLNPQTNQPADIITGTNFTLTTYTDPKGYQASGLAARCNFNFVGHIGGWYKVRVINCIDRATPSTEVKGNTYIDLPESFNYYLEGPPAIYDAYVLGYVEADGSFTPVATSQKRNFVYDDRPYMYRIRIIGLNFDEQVAVYLGAGSADPPNGDNVFEAYDRYHVDEYTLDVDFNIAPSVADDQRGLYWLYAKNANGLGAAMNPAFDIRRPAPIIYGYSVNTYGLWQNYYDVRMTLEGECFDDNPLTPQTDFELRLRKNTEPAPTDYLVASEAMDEPVSSLSGRRVSASLNFIDCDLAEWELYGVNSGGGTDSRYQDAIRGYEYRAAFEIKLGVPVLRTADVPSTSDLYSLKIKSRYQGCDTGGVWTDWSAWDLSTEGELTYIDPMGPVRNAWAWENDPDHGTVNLRTRGEMYFVEVRGMGFEKGGTLSVHVKNDNAPPHTGIDKQWTGLQVKANRSQARVWVEMDESMKSASGPDEGGFAEIRLRNDSTGTWQPWYVDRIVFKREG